MYSIPPTETVIENKYCRHCQVPFPITDKDIEFYDKISPVFNDKKYSIPTPTLCPDCRQQRRLSFRNERSLYHRKCSLTGNAILSIYSPDKSYVVYNKDDWWGDNWDATDYGQDFDFSKSFFEQFRNLTNHVPRLSLHMIGNENCDFVNQCGYSKGCYLSYNTDYSENCYYCKNVIRSKDCTDVLNADNCENCHNSLDIDGCYKCFNIQECKSCNNVLFSFGLENCSDCFGCTDLKNKKYHIFNKEYSKEDYKDKIKSYLDGGNNEIRNQFKKNNLKFPKKANILHCENISGDNLLNSRNLKYCFDCFSDEDSAYCNVVSNGKNIYDFDVGGYECELNLEVVSSGDKNINCMSCTNIWGNCSNIYYSDIALGSNNLFGCIGLRNKSYCILNKQYTKEEYEILVPKIIEYMQKTREWGEFFPSSLSPFGYNETVAMEYFPMTRTDAINRVSPDNKPIFNWSDYEAPFPRVEKIIPAAKLPEDIAKIPDDILNWAIECEVTGKPFRIIKQELEFYRKHNLPIPRRHPDQRHLDRMALRNPRKLFERKCDKCGVEMMTTYAPERPEVVYCESCYNKEIY